MALTDKLTAIADAIRAKTGTSEPLTLDEMAVAIMAIKAGYDLPAYWKTYLDSKVNSIKTKIDNASSTTAVFGYFTDAHVKYRNSSNEQVEGNSGHTGEIMKYLTDKAGVPRWIFGGDALAYENTQALVQSSFDTVASWLSPVEHMVVKGNHDLNPYGNPHLTDAQYQSMFFNSLEPNANGKNYYYVDDASKKTRYIVLDTRETSINASVTGSDATEKAYVQAEIDWLYSTLNSTPSGYQIICLPHIMWWSGGNVAKGNLVLSEAGGDVSNLLGYYNKRASGTQWGKAYDFTNGKAKAVLVLTGHTHIDYSHTYNGIVTVSSTADSYQYANERPDSRQHIKGTVTEQALDIWFVDQSTNKAECIRIGCGEDRTFTIGSGQICKVTNNLTNATTSNTAKTAIESYKATITASDGKNFTNGNYSVKCNEYDITAKYCAISSDSRTLTIDTKNYLPGDIEVTARAEAVPTYTVTNNLTNASTTNNTSVVQQGASYSATITANTDYNLGTVTCTMGGVAQTVTNGVINIENVTGNIVITANATATPRYTVTNKLTNATNSNKTTSVKQNGSYTATITADSGYNLDSVSCTMGGVNQTVTNGKISISKVTGNIVITAVASKPVNYTNILRTEAQSMTDSSIYNNGLGYKNGYYSSVGKESANSADCITGLIPYAIVNTTQPTDVIYIKGYTGEAGASHTRCSLWNNAKASQTETNGFLASGSLYFSVEKLADGYYKLTPKDGIQNSYNNIGYVRFSFHQPDGSGIVITRNEPIE